MIKINLLPPEVAKRQGPSKGFKIPTGGIVPYLLGLAIIYGGAGYAGFVVYKKGDESKRLLLEAQAKKEKKEKEIKAKEVEVAQLRNQQKEIEEKLRVVESMNPENRIFWSEKLNMIAAARMDLAVYVTKMDLTEEIVDVQTEESKREIAAWKAKATHPPGDVEPPIKKAPRINQTLILSAIAYGNDSPQRIRQIVAFGEVLNKFSWNRKTGVKTQFVENMNSQFEQIDQKLDKVGGIDVMRFGLKIKANPQSQKEQKPEAGGAKQ